MCSSLFDTARFMRGGDRAGHLAAVLLSAMLFAAVLVSGALTLILYSAMRLVITARLRWLQRGVAAESGKRSAITLDADYEVVTDDRGDVNRT